jgi:hypothetical protein
MLAIMQRKARRGLGCSSSAGVGWAPLGAPLRCVRNSQGRGNVSRASERRGDGQARSSSSSRGQQQSRADGFCCPAAGTDSARDSGRRAGRRAMESPADLGRRTCSGRAKSTSISYEPTLPINTTHHPDPTDRSPGRRKVPRARLKKTTTLLVCVHPSPIWPPQHRYRQGAYRPRALLQW